MELNDVEGRAVEPGQADLDAVVAMRGVRLIRSGRDILSDVGWRVGQGERWVVLGPNGAGKTTLLQLASTYEVPSRGVVHVLGHRVGRVYLPELRPRIGYSSTPLQRLLDPELTVLDAIATGRHAVLRRWRETYDGADAERAAELAERVGLSALAERTVEGCRMVSASGCTWRGASWRGPSCSCWTSPPPAWTSPDGSCW